MASDSSLQIRLALFGASVLFGVEAAKAQGRLRYGFGGATCLAVAAALLWDPLATLFPRFADFSTRVVAGNGPWYVLILAAFLLLRSGSFPGLPGILLGRGETKRRNSQQVPSPSPEPLSGESERQNPDPPPAVGNTTPEVDVTPSSAFLAPTEGERNARPHLVALRARSEVRQLPGRPQEVVGEIAIRNETASIIEGCSVVVESLVKDGFPTTIGRPLRGGKNQATVFGLTPKQQLVLNFLHRRVNVAPEEPFCLLLDSGPLPLEERSKYQINLRLEPHTGVVTRCVVEVSLGEYEDAKVALGDQASFKLGA